MAYDAPKLPEAKLRRLVSQVLDAADEFIRRHPDSAFARWQQERFLAQVERRLPLAVVDGAHGTRYVVRPQDEFIGRMIMRRGAFDPEKIDAVLTLLRENSVMIRQLLDIGANIGTTTVEMLRRLPDVTGVALSPIQPISSCCG